jgi:hypothetical protein
VLVADETRELGGVLALVFAPDGAILCTERDVIDLVAAALSREAQLVAIPVSRLAPEFFRLSSGFAGELIQKCVNYRLRVAIVGDISGNLAGSAALRDFVRESNRREEVCFVDSMDALSERLTRR